ncbi:hypothetical protein E2320_022842 [Naja naja]|nr:hypothetical protein E2320_022842 [Naja naja]
MSGVSPTPRCSFRKYSKTPINLEHQMCWSLHPACLLAASGKFVVHHPLEKIELGKAELFHRSPRPTQTQTRPVHLLNPVDQSYISTTTIISHQLFILQLQLYSSIDLYCSSPRN